MSKIEIKKIEDLKNKLSKSQIAYFRDKTKAAMDAYEQLMNAKDESDDPLLMEKVYGIYIFVIYRSVFGNNYISKNVSILLDYTIFLNNAVDNDIFKIDNIEEYNKFHEFIFGLVNQLYVHTDLCTKYKTINIDKEIMKGFKNEVEKETREERGVNLDGITVIANILATAHYSILRIMEGEEQGDNVYCTKYDKGGWLTISYNI